MNTKHPYALFLLSKLNENGISYVKQLSNKARLTDLQNRYRRESRVRSEVF